MKKALLATCVLALAAMGIPNASASPATSARASAFGAEAKTTLTGEAPLVDRTGVAESVLPPGGPVGDDVASLGETGAPVIETAGKVLANTSFESTIVPILFEGNQATGGGSGPGAGIGGDILGGGGIPILGGGSGGGLPLGGVAGLSNGDGTVQAQQVPALPIPGVGGGGGDPLGGILGGLPVVGDVVGGQTPDPVGNRQPNITIPLVNGQGYAVVDNLGLLLQDLAIPGDTTGIVAEALVSELLGVEAVQAEAVVVCNGTSPLYQTASRLADLNDEGLTAVDDLANTLGDALSSLGVATVTPNETGQTADGGVFVNGLHVIIGGDTTGGGGTPGVTVPTVPGVTVPTVPGVGTAANSFQAQQVPAVPGVGGEPILDLVIAHAEVSGATVCAAAAAPPAVQQPTGDARPSLPRTGGGLGLLPAVLTLGLLGAAVTGGRVALRSRRSANSSTL